MRTVLLGAGSIGQRHLRNLQALGHEVVAVVDPDRARLDAIQPLVAAGCRLVVGEAEALGADADAAVICSPTSRHVDQARAALRRGWHVFVEKPLAHTLEGTAALVDEAARAGRTVLVGCNLRFLPSLQLVKRLLDGGRLEVVQESIKGVRTQMFLDEMHLFARCVLEGAAPVVGAGGALAILEVALAAKASAVAGRPVESGR